MLTQLRLILAAALLAAGAVLLWRLETVTTERDKALERVGTLEQSNSQLAEDLRAERTALRRLESDYQREQVRIADLVHDLETRHHAQLEQQKRMYDAANLTDCGRQPLPDDLIRLRNNRTAPGG